MKNKAKWLFSCLLICAMIVSCAACGSPSTSSGSTSTSSASASTSPAPASTSAETSTVSSASALAPLKIDFFATLANYQGLQSGWYGKILKDKFNLEINIIAPNVAGGGDTLYQTRTAAGNLGDLICISRDKLNDCVKAGIIKDITQYIPGKQNLAQYDVGIKNLSAYLGDTSKVYGIPTKMSVDAPLTPGFDGLNPNVATYVRWDYYEELGRPAVNNLDDLANVLKQMQQKHPTSISGKKTYGISLFKDWDGCTMKNVAEVVSMYGWQGAGSEGISTNNLFVSTDGTKSELVTEDNGTYHNVLKFLFKANQMGILDPDSTSQNWDTLVAKLKDAQIYWSWNSWNSADAFNTKENGSKGIGYAYLPVGDQIILGGGNSIYGNDGYSFALGTSVSDENAKRLLDFLDWYASPESREILDAGIKGLTWTVENNEPVLTDYGLTAVTKNSPVPEEYGGGNYADGGCQFSNARINANVTDPNFNVPYIPGLWPSTIAKNRTKLDDNWTAANGAANPFEYFVKNPTKITVFPGTSWIPPTPSTDIQTAQAQINTVVVSTSWKMIFAKSQADFDSLWKDMKSQLPGLGYDECVANDKANIAAYAESYKKTITDAGK